VSCFWWLKKLSSGDLSHHLSRILVEEVDFYVYPEIMIQWVREMRKSWNCDKKSICYKSNFIIIIIFTTNSNSRIEQSIHICSAQCFFFLTSSSFSLSTSPFTYDEQNTNKWIEQVLKRASLQTIHIQFIINFFSISLRLYALPSTSTSFILMVISSQASQRNYLRWKKSARP
jgi:hypothetical protein